MKFSTLYLGFKAGFQYAIANKTRSIWVPILFGLAIREVFAPYTGHPFDFEIWIRLGYYVSKGHDPYSVTGPVPGLSFPGAGLMTSIGYPPIWPFVQAGIYLAYSSLGVDNRFLYYFIIKQPMILGDLLAGYLIFRIIEKQGDDGRKAFRALSFWLFCPYTILISAVWGMFDQIVLDLVLISILLIGLTERSALIEAFGIVLKAIPLIFLPIFALAQKSTTRILLYLAISVAVGVFLSLSPYLVFANWNISGLEGTGSDVAGKISNSVNYWVIVAVTYGYGLLPGSLIPFLQFMSFIWIPAVIIGSIYCADTLWKNGISERDLFLSAQFVLVIFFLARSSINEQYVIYFIGLGIIDIYIRNRNRKIFNWVWLSALAFLLANNVYLIRFLEPISIYFTQVESQLVNGPAGDLRNAIMVVAGISFTISCLFYLRSLYLEIRRSKVVQIKVAPLSP